MEFLALINIQVNSYFKPIYYYPLVDTDERPPSTPIICPVIQLESEDKR